MLKPIRNNPQRERLDLGFCFGGRFRIDQHAGQVRDFGDPTAVLFLLELDGERHGNP